MMKVNGRTLQVERVSDATFDFANSVANLMIGRDTLFSLVTSDTNESTYACIFYKYSNLADESWNFSRDDLRAPPRPRPGSSFCSFNDRAIFDIGGIDPDSPVCDQGYKGGVSAVEIYGVSKNRWIAGP